MGDSETLGNAARGLLPLFRDCLIGTPHSLQHGGRGRLGCAAAERRFGRVRNRKLDGLRYLGAAQIGGDPQCAVDARRSLLAAIQPDLIVLQSRRGRLSVKASNGTSRPSGPATS